MVKFAYAVACFTANDPRQLEIELEEMGKEGWELVTIRGDFYIFKKIAPQPST